MQHKRTHTILLLVVAIIVYISVIITILAYSSFRFGRLSKQRTTAALQGIALNVEQLLFVMDQYAGTFMSAFGTVELDSLGYSRVVLTRDELTDFKKQDIERSLRDFVQSSCLVQGAFFCFEDGVFGDTAYQPYSHVGDSTIHRVQDLFPFTQSDLFESVQQYHHNWWHASRKKSVYGEAVLGCCLPIYANDTAHFIGTFVMDYSLDSLGSYLKMVRPFPSSELYLINSLGYIICPTDSFCYGHPITDVPDWEISSYGNKIVSFPTLPWQIALVTPQTDVEAFMRSYLSWIVVIALIGLILLSLCVYYVMRTVRQKVREQEAIQSELQAAAHIQRSLLPAALPQLPDVEIDALLRPAKEVAGDLYEVQHEGDYLYFMVGDVSGKGLQASLMMALVGGMFRMRVHEVRTPAGIMNLMNFAFSERNTEMLFCTILIGRLHLGSGELMLCNAGHNLPVLNNSFINLPAGLPVGVDAACVYSDNIIHLQANDRFYCYTDGVTEAENHHHQLFGDERLLSLCQQRATLQQILQSVTTFTDGQPQSDDITMLSLTYHRLVLHSIQDIEHLHPYLYPPASERSLLPTTFYLLPKHSELAIEEAMVNPLMHGKATYVSLLINQQSATIEDNGISFDPVAYNLSPVACNLSSESGGHGISLIRQITQEMKYLRLNNTNVLTLFF